MGKKDEDLETVLYLPLLALAAQTSLSQFGKERESQTYEGLPASFSQQHIVLVRPYFHLKYIS